MSNNAMEIKFSGNTLTINNKEVVLPHKLKQYLFIGKLVVVRVDSDVALPLNNQSLNKNILAFDGQANLIWEIQEAPHGGSHQSKPYMDIREVNGRLVAGNWIGVDYAVNLATGVVKPNGSGERPW